MKTVKNNTRTIEKLIVYYINKERRKRHLFILFQDRGLRYLARRHSKRMAKKRKIWHGRNVRDAQQFLTKLKFEGTLIEKIVFFFRYRWYSGFAGENCALMYRGRVKGFPKPVKTDKDIAKTIHSTLMKSAGHRANILDNNFRRIGVGVKRRKNGFYATELFFG